MGLIHRERQRRGSHERDKEDLYRVQDQPRLGDILGRFEDDAQTTPSSNGPCILSRISTYRNARRIGGLMDVIYGLGLLALLVGVYFIPSMVAADRKVSSVGSVVVINLFLGWTILGWVVALALAMRTPPTKNA